jgi:3-hydroxymyristoyl/3-hydroxydecanoyl-(acyl carrier protein) dehydratase
LRKIKKEVEQYLSNLASGNGTHTSQFRFPEAFIGFQGHIPEKKILPGVCQLQAVLTTLEKAKKKQVDLREVVSAKYFSPILPDEEFSCECSDTQDKDGDTAIKAVLFRKGAKVAEFKLRVRLHDGTKDRRA